MEQRLEIFEQKAKLLVEKIAAFRKNRETMDSQCCEIEWLNIQELAKDIHSGYINLDHK